MTNSHNLVNKSINILSKKTLFFNINSTNLKIFLGSNTVVNMATNMAVRSMYTNVRSAKQEWVERSIKGHEIRDSNDVLRALFWGKQTWDI